MFAIVYPFDRSRSIVKKHATATFDTIRIADEFRTDPVDVAGIDIVARDGDTADVALVFEQDVFSESAISKGRDAIRRHSTGGKPSGDPAEILTDPPDRFDPEKFDPEFMIEW